MMSISRFNPAACNNSLEIAPALANLNFDFSLYKVEAPKEFIGVGSHLSTMRRETAENGQVHMTARRLGALFEATLPPIPVLTRSYGQRASEICQVSSLTPETRKQYRIFSEQMGTDATSIWAAATSGTAAIAVHLLACLLARMFDDAEATSIWVELVHTRKKAIESRFDETNTIHMSTLQATRQIVQRSQLAEWDSSARAWLRMADRVKKRQHAQLKLVMDNVDLSVNQIPETYESVINAWTSCLVKVEGLLEGLAQQAGQGDVLLATSAWHLYPDMLVIVPSETHINQHDPLFQNQALLTVGLELPQHHRSGVSWSLPLKYLRYYGAPVIQTSSLSTTERSRLSLEEFMYVVLGCVIAKDSEIVESSKILRCFCKIFSMIEEQCKVGSAKAQALIEGPAKHSWISLILRSAVQYSNLTGNARSIADKLLALGRRHDHNFLGVPSDPMFGLMSDGRFITIMSTVALKVRSLREIASKYFKSEDYNRVIIHYKGEGGLSNLASALPFPGGFLSRNLSEGLTSDIAAEHLEWPLDSAFAESRWSHDYNSVGVDWSKPKSPQILYDLYFTSGESPVLRYGFWYGDDQSAAIFIVDALRDRPYITRPLQKRAFYETVEFQHCDTEGLVERISYGLCSPYDIMTAHYPNPYTSTTDGMPFSYRMRVIATIVKLYESLAGATIDINVLLRPIEEAKWLSVLPQDTNLRDSVFYAELDRYYVGRPLSSVILPIAINRSSAFACVTLLETGRYNIDPNRLEKVMAISHEDSLYISSALVEDPSIIDLDSPKILRLSGNIGRPGISFLVPPPKPLTREVSISEWPLLGESNFDGNMHDAFSESSLHISFTGAEASIDVGFSGAQGEVARTIETVISVHEKGKWVADLNPWAALYEPDLAYRLVKLQPCHGQFQHLAGEFKESMTSVDNWIQLIDENMGAKVRLVQSKGNSEARFAAMCVSVSLDLDTMVLSDNPCWHCVAMRFIYDQRWNTGPRQAVLIA